MIFLVPFTLPKRRCLTYDYCPSSVELVARTFKMPSFSCAVADCKSAKWKNPSEHPHMNDVKGWVRFPSIKKEPQRRKLWETRCKRGHSWRATTYHAICYKHFTGWRDGKPSQEHPNPECFAYNDWGNLPKQRKENLLQVQKSYVLAGGGGGGADGDDGSDAAAVPMMPADVSLIDICATYDVGMLQSDHKEDLSISGAVSNTTEDSWR